MVRHAYSKCNSAPWQHSATHSCINPRKIGQNSLENTGTSAIQPNLSPCDYHMFGALKEELGDHHFDDDDGEETFMRNWM